MSDDSYSDGTISIIEYAFMAVSWAAWGLLFLAYIAAAVWVLIDIGFRPKIGTLELWIGLLSLIPLAGFGFSLLLPMWLHSRGKRGLAMAVSALSLVLWLPAVVCTAIMAVL